MKALSPTMARLISGLATVGALALSAVASGQQASDRPTVTLTQGGLVGREDGAVTAFLGIPYAAAPVGANRWRAPHPAPHWRGYRDATRYGASCMQSLLPAGRPPWTSEYMARGPVSEDCLSLNVWTPGTTAAKLPVLVWIHGGAFTEGSGSVPIYRGAALAGKGVVVVTINYRLGLFGFLAHPDLTREAGNGPVSNFGLQDQIAALRWVRDNIARFGGDPNQVTVAGQSAGSMAVHSLVASPLARGLFVRAIAQSGLPTVLPIQTLRQAEERGLAFAGLKHAASLDRLRAMTPAQLALPPAKGAAGPDLAFGPIVDGRLLPDSPGAMVAKGTFNDVPMIIGQTADEGSAFPGYGLGDAASYQAALTRRFGNKAPEFIRLYPGSTDAERSRAAKDAAHDGGLAMVGEWAHARIAKGSRPVWGYLYSHAEPGPGADVFGAFHSSEIPYAFGTLDMAPARGFTLADRELSLAMSEYWVNFVRSGNPNGPGLPGWKPMDANAPTIIEFEASRIAERPLLSDEKRKAFRQFLADGGQLSMF